MKNAAKTLEDYYVAPPGQSSVNKCNLVICAFWGICRTAQSATSASECVHRSCLLGNIPLEKKEKDYGQPAKDTKGR